MDFREFAGKERTKVNDVKDEQNLLGKVASLRRSSTNRFCVMRLDLLSEVARNERQASAELRKCPFGDCCAACCFQARRARSGYTRIDREMRSFFPKEGVVRGLGT